MNRKKILQSILVLGCICIAAFTVSCQDEENETKQNEETLSKTAPLTGLFERVAMNATADDNIIDSTSCFSVKLPVSLIVNSQAVTINTENDYHLVNDIFEVTDADHDYVDFVFPITIVYPDYREVVVQNETQFNALRDDCQEPEPGERNIACVSIHYPIRVFGYNSNFQLAHTYTIHNDLEFFLLLFNLGNNEFYAVDYPITITNRNGIEVTIRNNIEMLGAIQDCVDNICPNPNILTNDLIIYMPFANEVRDLVSRDLAVPAAAPTFVTDRSGNVNSAISFTRTNFLTLNTTTARNIEVGNSVTVSLWFRMQNTEAGDFERMFEKSNGSMPYPTTFGVGVYDGNTPLVFWPQGGLWDMSWNVDQNLWNDTTNWHHLVVTVQHDTPNNIDHVKMYRDGVLRNSEDVSNIFLNTQALDYIIGKNFEGYLDDLRVYKKVLTPQQVTTLFQLEGDTNTCFEN
ncbi:LamG domain-containing protein [Flavobacterium sp. WW92]|uniref:LamG domain-containing protein n=1 Tax=unclassified Flavobacterium TaxID=196869 RepID=UPI0022242B28|nr:MULTISPECIES: LamG domain-containing protein [unclassified Flavobacterium]WDO13015.1 LamG domain-containing protein [Flavobacterium sp. WW92]